jgi:hypothetical protein
VFRERERTDDEEGKEMDKERRKERKHGRKKREEIEIA